MFAAYRALALDGGQVAEAKQFEIVGTIAAPKRQGFPAAQIAPSWVLTAAHSALG
jgi:hypothetical protein